MFKLKIDQSKFNCFMVFVASLCLEEHAMKTPFSSITMHSNGP